MDKKGSIVAQVYTSKAQLPVENATVTVFTPSREGQSRILATRMTDKSGKTTSVIIDTPELTLSQNPGNPAPFSLVDIKISHPEFYSILVRDVQVFSDTETLQYAALIPVSETDSRHDATETVDITPQNL